MLEKATAILSKTLNEPSQSKAKRWLRTLIEDGFPLSGQREPSTEPDDGGLLNVQMETEVHVYAVYCLARAIARDNYLDLASESSGWKYGAVGAHASDAASCGFTESESCSPRYFSAMSALRNGTPLFGDGFRTKWSFYTLFSNDELAALIPVFQAAADFKRIFPKEYPETYTKNMQTTLSKGSRDFVLDLINWFDKLHQAKQDALILWW